MFTNSFICRPTYKELPSKITMVNVVIEYCGS